MASIQSKDIPLEFSADGTTWLKLVCRTSNNFKSDISITEEETDCGIEIGLGAQKWGFDFSAVVKKDPATDEASYKQILQWHTGKTKVQVRQQSGASGVDFYQGGEAYFTSVAQDYSTNSVIKFSGSLKGVGGLDLAA